jgi:signal peptidase I
MIISTIRNILTKNKYLIISILILVFVKSFIFDVSLVPTGSMKLTILPGDFLLITKYDYGYNGYSIAPLSIPQLQKKYWKKAPKQGDIATFKFGRKTLIKRVIGLPGQKIQFIEGALLIDDIPVQKHLIKSLNAQGIKTDIYKEKLPNGLEYEIIEKHNLSNAALAEFQNTIPYYIPENHYFFLGDNRFESKDSRFIGAIPEDKITAKAKYIIFSFQTFRNLKYLKRSFLKL